MKKLKIDEYPTLSKGWIDKEIERRIEKKKRDKKIEGIIWGIVSFGMGLWVCWLVGIAYVRWLAGGN